MENLRRFRQQRYEALGKAKDAVFELMDAVLLTRSVSSLAELSLCPVFRRKWSSIYEGLEDSRPQKRKLRKSYIEQIPQESQKRVLLAGDHTDWPRPEVVTLLFGEIILVHFHCLRIRRDRFLLEFVEFPQEFVLSFDRSDV